MKLLELPVLKSRNLNLKACAFKSLIVLFLCYNILFYFDLYSSLAVTNRLCIYILLNINIEKLKIKAGIAKLSHLLSEAVVRRYSVKKGVHKISQNSQENTCARVSFLIKLQAQACSFIKKVTLAQVFSCKFFEFSKNIFLHRTPLVAASVLSSF